MALKDIQARLDEKVTKQAEKDFAEAKKQASKILEPFIEALKYTDCRQPGELEAYQEEFAKHTRISNYGDLLICDHMGPPKAYVRLKQAEASKEFIDKVSSLQDQIDELYSEVNDR
jgi:hypothetical protein